ncbi:MAG: DUF3108 domain-containing protein [Bryobacterales bacterium]|nr:DUF3108 domain-containing protein [Bryobacterales bacterium]
MTALRHLSALLSMLAVAAPAETLHYDAEWRLMRAGEATIQYANGTAKLTLKTTGLAGSLYHVDDRYTVAFDTSFCASSSLMNAEEGSKRLETRVTFNQPPGTAVTLERDLKKDATIRKEITVPACVHDVIAGLARLRANGPQPGQTVQFPISDGRKSIQARIDALERETVKTPAGTFPAIKYEAHLFGGQLYRRKGRLYLWISDDKRRVPVQIKVQLPFYIGSVTLQLVKEESS